MGGCRGVGEGDDDGGEEQQYSLRWSDFHASLASSFRRLRDDEDFVDVTLACDGRSFTAHKVVLSACSPYFRRLLKANPCQHPIVILRDVKQRDLEALLRFMYNGEVQIGQDQLSGFLATAQMLEVRGLAEVPSNSKEHHSYGHHHTPHSRGPPPARANATSTPNSVPWGEPGSGSGDRRDDNHVSQHHGRGTHHHNTRRHHDGTLSSPPPKRSRADSPGSTPAPVTSAIDSMNHPTPDHGGRDSLLGQALEGSTPLNSHHYQGGASSGEESSSEDESEHNAEGGEGNTSAIETPSLPPPPKREPMEYHDDLPSHHRGVSPSLSTVDLMNTSGLDLPRTPTFPGALLQGLPGLLPGPSGLHNSTQDVNYVSSRRTASGGGGSGGGGAGSLDMMRVRATDPRPCPKCGKIYRSAHTLRTHLEDKHTVCPGYRCVLCGTVAKSRNSLHSHMSRQHRGISTKDLPVLPMPAPFDPELASRLLAKAGVKVSAAELAARASPTGGPRRSDLRLDLKSASGPGGRTGEERNEGGRGRGEMGDDVHTPHHRSHHHHQHRGGSSSRHSEGAGSGSVCGGDDPEDLSVPNSRYGSEMAPSPPPGTAPSQYRGLPHGANGPRGANGKTRSIDSIAQSLVGAQAQAAAAAAAAAASGGTASTGSAILDTYLQLIAENSGGLALGRAAAIAAAKAAGLAIPGEEEMEEGEDYGEEEEEDEEEDEEEEASDEGEETSMAGGEGKSREEDGGGEREVAEREGETSGGEYSEEEEEEEEDAGGQEGHVGESGGNGSAESGIKMEDTANEMGGSGEGSGGIVEGVE